MPYLIDSDWLIDFIEDDPVALALIRQLVDEAIAISVVTYMEVYEGTLRGAQPDESRRRLGAIARTVPVLGISEAVARRCASIRHDLRREGKRVNQRALGLLNAAIALEYDLTIVTRNTEDYADIQRLGLRSG